MRPAGGLLPLGRVGPICAPWRWVAPLWRRVMVGGSVAWILAGTHHSAALGGADSQDTPQQQAMKPAVFHQPVRASNWTNGDISNAPLAAAVVSLHHG